MDYYGNGKINYSEFLAATLSANDTITDEMLWQVFKTFDVDNTDFIS
jgi:Ca2+-binding EF-hand superfamily protein